MSENIKLTFDDGYKNIEINGDPNKIIRINPTDTAFIQRLAGFEDKVEEIKKKYGDIDLSALNFDGEDTDSEKMQNAAMNVEKLEQCIRELINYVFGYDICAVVFGTASCLSPVGGRPVYLNFMDVMFDYIAAEAKKQTTRSQAKISKYTAAAKQTDSEKSDVPYSVDLSKLSSEDKDALLRQLING